MPSSLEFTFEAISEDRPGEKWRRAFDRHWHAYSRWFLRSGKNDRPTYLECRRAIRKFMPELMPLYEEVCEAAGGGDLEARFLSMWCPPAYVGGCSQVILRGPPVSLLRSYDYSPKLFEGAWFASRYFGKRVVAMVDCLWGVLDGINEDGLAVSLSFGGRTTIGEGFGIPLVLRYVLEMAEDVQAAIAILTRVPVHMSYSIAMVDRKGEHAVVYVNPDRPIEITSRSVVTNHQRLPEWKRHAEATRSVEREQALLQAVSEINNPEAMPEAMINVFLRAPVLQTAYMKGYGTLYAAHYRPEDASVELIWPTKRWRQSCADFLEGSLTLDYAAGQRNPGA